MAGDRGGAVTSRMGLTWLALIMALVAFAACRGRQPEGAASGGAGTGPCRPTVSCDADLVCRTELCPVLGAGEGEGEGEGGGEGEGEGAGEGEGPGCQQGRGSLGVLGALQLLLTPRTRRRWSSSTT